jgi:multidrug efflux pump
LGEKKSPTILFAINVISPDGRFDDLYLSNYATIHLLDELLRIKGVGDITLFGQRSYAMRIWLDPDELAARDITAVDVVNAVRSQNVQVAAGQVGQEPVPPGQALQLTMRTLGRLENEEQFADIVVKTGQGNPQQGNPSPQVVRVRDVARVELAAQNYDISSRLDGQPAAGMGVFLLPGSNALDVADAVKRRMEELKSGFPQGLEYRILYDTTPFIRQSVDEVFNTLFIAVLLVALVVLFFLQDWKAMILPMIDVPVSLVGTFAVMALLGFSLNNLTLFGLVLAIGIVVDDAIVVLENIERLIGTGLDSRTATIKAMEEITGPIIAITLVLSSVFLPSTLVPGLNGQFYRQFAVTISVAMIISAINAMTLTPSRAVAIFSTGATVTPSPSEEQAASEEDGRVRGATAPTHEPNREALPWWIFAVAGGAVTLWLAPADLATRLGWQTAGSVATRWLSWAVSALAFLPGALVGGVVGWFIIGIVNAGLARVFRGFNRVFDWVTHLYGRAVSRLLRLSAIVLVVYGGLLFLTYWSLARAPVGFIPTQDQGYLLVKAQLPDAASVQRTREVMLKIDQIVRNIPGVAHTVGIAGQSFLLGTNGSNLGSMFIVLAPFEQRRTPDTYDATIAQKIQEQCRQEIEQAIVSVFRAPPVRGLANAGGFKLQVEERGYVDLQELQAQTDRLIQAANADPHFAGVFTIFRANTPQVYVDIDRTKVEALQVPIQDVFTSLQVYMGGLYVNDFNKFGRTWEVQVEAAPAYRASADEVKRLKVRNAQGRMVPMGSVARIENTTGPVFAMRYNMYTSASVNGNQAPGVSTGEVIQYMTQIANDLGIAFEWTELIFLQLQAGNIALLVFALGTVLVYLVLAAKYESWRLPLAVILVVPLCILAAVSGMTIAHLPVDIFVQIGLLVLIGLASKNAILIVEYARQIHEEGKDLHEAALDASKIRFRPIIMTSLAFIFGVLPLVVATGAGAEMRQSLGTAVFSGMIGVTLFGIFRTPVFFFYMLWLRESKGRSNRTPPRLVARASTDGASPHVSPQPQGKR